MRPRMPHPGNRAGEQTQPKPFAGLYVPPQERIGDADGLDVYRRVSQSVRVDADIPSRPDATSGNHRRHGNVNRIPKSANRRQFAKLRNVLSHAVSPFAATPPGTSA